MRLKEGKWKRQPNQIKTGINFRNDMRCNCLFITPVSILFDNPSGVTIISGCLVSIIVNIIVYISTDPRY